MSDFLSQVRSKVGEALEAHTERCHEKAQAVTDAIGLGHELDDSVQGVVVGAIQGAVMGVLLIAPLTSLANGIESLRK